MKNRTRLALSLPVVLSAAACGGAQTPASADETAPSVVQEELQEPACSEGAEEESWAEPAWSGPARSPVTFWEICVQDPAALATFYTAVFGWQFSEPTPIADVNMWFVNTIAADGSGTDGALCERAEPDPYLALYITVDDLEDTVARLEAADGPLMYLHPSSHPGGMYAMFLDNAGHLTGLMSWDEEAPISDVGDTAHPVVFWEYGTTGDPKALADLFAPIFGWEYDWDEPNNYAMMHTTGAKGDRQWGIDGGIGAAGELGDYTAIYVATNDLQATLDLAVAHGAEVMLPVMELSPDMSVAMFRDPAGIMVGLVSR